MRWIEINSIALFFLIYNEKQKRVVETWTILTNSKNSTPILSCFFSLQLRNSNVTILRSAFVYSNFTREFHLETLTMLIGASSAHSTDS